MEENENEEKEPIDKVYWAKSWSWNDEIAIDFRWSDVQGEDEEDIAKASLI